VCCLAFRFKDYHQVYFYKWSRYYESDKVRLCYSSRFFICFHLLLNRGDYSWNLRNFLLSGRLSGIQECYYSKE